MTAVLEPPSRPPGFLDRARTVAPPGFNRWLVPPAALAIHLCIGEVYAFSVFKLPLTQLVGIDHAAPGDWTQPSVAWVFSIAIVFLGLSAALFGSWLERAGPRKAMFASAACFGGGFLVSAAGVWLHQIGLLYLGYGVLGGIGLGLGYISPVSTLIKWFPDRPGMATGLAIMGFGGGAMVASPLSNFLMHTYRSPSSTGVAESFATLGALYFAFMMFGALTVRVPAAGWTPPGAVRKSAPRTASVTPADAIRTPQFWLLWAVLLLNVTAGIGVLEQASPMIQEMFPGRVSAGAAAGFVGLLSLFNMAGRFLWSSTSDAIGRKPTYAIFFALGAVLYALTPTTGHLGNVVLFIACYAVILSMYGGGFATIPAYLRDQFGTGQVGAIHGRLLTAWSLAGVAGPLLVNYIREAQIADGVPKAEAYTVVMYLMAGLLIVGFVCNILVRRAVRVPQTASEVAAADAAAAEADAHAPVVAEWPTVGFRWACVAVPLAWGVSMTVVSSLPLFR
ncbi:L-lactate MFS transporter [Frigoriglobus tundricola]|uniref:Putative MFS-type transporter n=1 Tax=Frigoriglobus tundricola TaxID=2774151 RepID=A0A6M5YWF4_9BACT|nr:OFA family MFS transporter [Frigoriglobus tundricola]QJW97726.1 putative MFS-type transporter [Frigoriglobus tundricola]